MENYNYNYDSIDIATLNLKLLSKVSKKNILFSAGKIEDKRKILPCIKNLSSLNVNIYATNGTSKFLSENKISNQKIYKVAEKKEPNIKTYLYNERFDLVVNILTGDQDYDESSDSKLIRTLSVEFGIPLLTDVEIAILTIEKIIKEQKQGIYQYKIKSELEPWNLKSYFISLVSKLKGFACYHAHFDKSYLISLDNLKLSQISMKKKWDLYKYLKESYTYDDLIERISRCVRIMIQQGVTYCRTFVDADNIVKLLPIQAALEVKEKYKDQIFLEIAVQPLQGLLDNTARKYFEKACELADVIGGLPSRDRPFPEKHIDYIMKIAKEMNKKLDVHIDQENNPFEDETELLAKKTIEHNLEGKVSGIHAISLSAKDKIKKTQIINLIKDAKLNIIVCPSAAISMQQLLDINAPLHNSIAPVVDLLQAEIPIYIGIDNVSDLFMPLVDGDMWFECRMLMEACRFYDIEKVAQISCDKSGFSTFFT